MRPLTRNKKIVLAAAAASTSLLGFVGYPAIKSVYPIKKQTTIVDDYVDLPTATADLTKDVPLPEGVGAGTDIPVDVSHWLLLSMLKSKRASRRDRALDELARQRRWNDAECMEIAQALDKKDIIKLSRTIDADLRLFLSPPSVDYIEKALDTNKIEKVVKSILKELSDKTDSCSSCANFYTNLSIRMRPNYDILAMNDLNQVDKMMRIESKKRKQSIYNENVVRLKAVLNNILCGEEQAESMVKAGLLIALLYIHHKYKNDVQINGLLSQIVANITLYPSIRDYIFTNGWIQILTQYTRSEQLEISMPAFKALANLDEESVKTNGVYGNHIYLLAPLYRVKQGPKFDVIFVHGLVGSVFKSWRQGSIALDEQGNQDIPDANTPTTELLPVNLQEQLLDDSTNTDHNNSDAISGRAQRSRCWPKDWLAEDAPGSRILAVDYPTALSNWRTDCDLNKDTLRDRAIHVMRQLEDAKIGDRPIIWVAHSMGGLLVKQILVLSDELSRNERKSNGSDKQPSRASSLLSQTKGVIFYSVPHKGSNLDWIERKNLQKLLLLTTEVIELQKGSPVLMDLHKQFLDVIGGSDTSIKFLTYAEDSISSFGVNKVVQWKGVLVHDDSLHFEVGPVLKLHIDHAHTCKPHSRQAITYRKTLELIADLTLESPSNEEEKLLPFISFIL